jgi:hypothetical protein
MKKKSVAGSPAAKRDEALTEQALAQLGEELKASAKEAPFVIPETVEKVIERARELNKARDEEEVELSALLHKLEADRTYNQYECANLSEFAVQHLDMSGSKARALSAAWSHFLNLGLKPEILGGKDGVSFVKFKLLLPCITRDVINKDNVAEWLPLIKKEGKTALTRQAIESKIKTLTAKAQTDESDDDKLVRVSFMLRGSLSEPFRQLIEMYKEATGVSSDGEAIFHGMNAASASIVERAQGQASIGGIINLMNMISRLASVAPLIYSDDPGITLDTIGVPVINKVYYAQSWKVGTAMCLATDISAAAKFMQVDKSEVRVFSLALSPELKPQIVSADMTSGVAADGEAEATQSNEDDTDMTNRNYSGPNKVTLDDVNKTIVFTLDGGKEMTGVIASVKPERGYVFVKGHRGRPKAVKFEDVVSIRAEADIAPEKKKPGRRGRPAKNAETPAPEPVAGDGAEDLRTTLRNLAEARVKAMAVTGGESAQEFTFRLRSVVREATDSAKSQGLSQEGAELRGLRAGIEFVSRK